MPAAINVLVLLVLVLAVAAWSLAIGRLRRGEPLVAYCPRRQVRWQGRQLALIVAAYLVAQWTAIEIIRPRGSRGGQALRPAPPAASGPTATAPEPLGADPQAGENATRGGPAASARDQSPDAAESPAAASPPRRSESPEVPEAKPDTTHPIVQLLRQRRGPWTIALVVLTAAIIAPLFEELFFRSLVQGWLEARQRVWRRRLAWLRRLPRGAVPVLASAAVFSSLHARGAVAAPRTADELEALLAANAAANLATLAVAAGVLQLGSATRLADLGLTRAHLGDDLRLGVLAFAGVCVPIYLLQFSLAYLFPDLRFATDPLALFPFAVVVGYLYYRTHRLAPSAVAHVSFNALGLAALALAPEL